MNLGLPKEIRSKTRPIPCFLSLARGKEKGLIITFTGFTLSGYEDKRMAVVNNAFSRLGFRVITPKIETIDALSIHPSGIEEVRAAIESITADPILNPKGFKPAVFAPSFTGGIAALAVAEMPAGSIVSLCLLGSYCNFESTIHYALSEHSGADDYGMHIILNNFMRYALGEWPELEALVQTAIADNGLRRKTPLLPALLASSHPEASALYHQLRNDAHFRRETIDKAWRQIPTFETWKNSLDLSRHAHKLSCPVTIIHGKDDNVIAASESELLYSLLQLKDSERRLALSALLDHGDPKIGLNLLIEVKSLAQAFNHFLLAIPSPKPSN